MKAKKIARFALLVALCLVLSYLESLIPPVFLPGMKLGLSNILVLYAFVNMSDTAAWSVNVIRIVVSSMLFGNMTAFIYSLCGGVLSTLIMMLLLKTKRFNIIAVSAAGGVFHNIGQILAAMLLLSTNVLWLMVILWFSGIACGLFTGFLGGIIIKRIPPEVTYET